MPLTMLAERLTLGPPSVSALIDLIENSEVVSEFVFLVREYLPEYEREIMDQDGAGRVESFGRLFGQRYFPLDEVDAYDEIEAMERLVMGIPIPISGVGYDDYHEFQQQGAGYILLLSLVVYPYVMTITDSSGMVKDLGKGESAAARVALLEQVAEICGPKVAQRIPKEGWTPEFLHSILDDTKFRGVADFADWICSNTGCYMLDANYEDAYDPISWSRENVESFTEEWAKVQQINERMDQIWLGRANILGESDKQRFIEILDFIEGRAKSQVPKEQMPMEFGESDD